MIRGAFEDLERAMTPTDTKDFKNTALQNVQKAALEIENRMAARQSLRNMRRIMPLFTGLGHYAKTIEVLCNGTPFLPWIWAPIKLILMVKLSCLQTSRAVDLLTQGRFLRTTWTPSIPSLDTTPV